MTIKMEEPTPDRIADSRIVQCISSPAGRVARVMGGVLLIAAGLLVVRGKPGLVLAAIGVVPLLSGALDKCGFSILSRGSCTSDD